MNDLHHALTVAYRHLTAPTTTEQEREHIVAACAEHFHGSTGELFARQLYHLREQQGLQLTLKNVLESNSRAPFGDGRAGK